MDIEARAEQIVDIYACGAFVFEGKNISVSLQKFIRKFLAEAMQEAYEAGKADANQWQSIETAKKDGSPIIGSYFYPTSIVPYNLYTTYWEEGDWLTYTSDEPVVWEPTHWKPLPPKEEAKK